jgi:bifunctional enzyme CysN/CysC
MDGEMLRSGLSNDLGYSVAERAENLRRSAHIARMLNDSGLICLIAMVAPEDSMRQRAGEVVGSERFITVHCDAPLEVCQQRDPSGKQDQITYDEPAQPDLRIETSQNSIQESVQQVMDLLRERKIIR